MNWQTRKLQPVLLVLAGSLLLAACSGGIAGWVGPTPTHTSPPASATPAPTETAASGESALSCDDPFGGENVRFRADFWSRTDFCQHSVPYGEIRSGGPPPDGIPPIDSPTFETIEAGDGWLGAEWPVMVLEHEGETRAYPLAILIWHEIVNDTIGGQPVAVTYCPLCNAAIAFERVAPDGRVLDFGTTGNLRNLDLVMYDRPTHSWWQQFTGEAIVGEYTGASLNFLPSRVMAWGDAKEIHPDMEVLSRDTGFDRYLPRYGTNPYAGYDDPDGSSPLGEGVQSDSDISPRERVAAVQLNGSAVAYPFSELAEAQVVNDEVGGTPVVVFWQGGVKSALDAGQMGASREVGSSTVFERDTAEGTLTFSAADEEGVYLDEETGSRWNFSGVAMEGPLEGTRLEPVVAGEHFWFAWAAFLPDIEIWTSS